MCKLSIITINYNNVEGLKTTLDSVAIQSCREFEHIIIDGGSIDGSVSVIKAYEERFLSARINGQTTYPRILWISEHDNGIYDAMNKGIAKASGDYLYFLNGGDTLASPTILHEMISLLDGTDFIIGRVNKSYKGHVVGQTPLLGENDMSLYNMYLRGINHQSALIKRDLLLKTPYDTSVKMGADWKFFVQTIVLGNASTLFVNVIFANFDLSGLSSDIDAIRREREAILDTIVSKRIARDYLAIAPHYYEVIRVGWLLQHPFWYRIYRALTTLGRKLCTNDRSK